MMDVLNIVQAKYSEYVGTGHHMLLFWVCVLVLAIWSGKRERLIDRFLVVLVMVICFIFACPITAKIIMDYCIGADTYWRMLWLLPTTLIIGYVGTNFVSEVKTKKRKVAMFVAVLFIVVSLGRCVYNDVVVIHGDTITKISPVVEELCQEIKRVSAQKGVTEIKAVMPEVFLPFVRQYDATIKMQYGRNGERYGGSGIEKLFYLLREEPMNYEEVSARCRSKACNFLVLQHEDEDMVRSNLQSVGFEYISNVCGYDVYYLKN